MKEGLIFANARAKAKELNLLTEERLHRIAEAKTVDDAVRVLNEAGYGGGTTVTVENFYDVIAEEEKEATEFIRKTAPKGVGIECFFLRNDYHNLKVLMKSKYAGFSDMKDMVLPDGNYSFDELKDRAENGKLGFVDVYMADAVKKIDKAFEADSGSPRFIDAEIDKALYREISAILSDKNADKYIREYFVTFVDATNIGTMLRTMNIKGDFAFFEENFLEGGTLGLHSFRECGMDANKFSKFIETTSYKLFYSKITDAADLSEYETAKDDFLLKIFAVNKADLFSVAPIVGYYLAKLNEIKILRVVIICLKNNVAAGEMRKRMRALYA
jgi:V/A-type H+-transporting ATPase subunit C